MKIKLSILLLSIVFVAMQACSSSADKKEQSDNASSAEQNLKPLTLAERQAKLENDRKALEEKRKNAVAELAKNTPYYELSSGELVYYSADTNPSFEGGDKAMNKFLRDNLKYPEEAKDDQLEGTVFVDFVISDKGLITNPEVTSYTLENIDQSFIVEAIRVVKLMPAWSPGLQNGKPVAVKYSIPITFMLR